MQHDDLFISKTFRKKKNKQTNKKTNKQTKNKNKNKNKKTKTRKPKIDKQQLKGCLNSPNKIKRKRR